MAIDNGDTALVPKRLTKETNSTADGQPILHYWNMLLSFSQKPFLLRQLLMQVNNHHSHALMSTNGT